MQVWAIIRDTIKEISVKKLFWINIALTMFVVLSMACWRFDEKGAYFLWYSFESRFWSTGNELFRSTISYAVVSKMLIGLYIGWVGVVLGLISTAGSFPTMMEKGSIDLVLARPISRWKIFLAKYAGGLFFMTVQATVFVVCTFVVMGLRWNIWLPGYLWSIPLLILLFSYLYCMCVLFGLWSRSAMASLLLTMAFWFVIWSSQVSYELMNTQPRLQSWHKLNKAAAILKWVVPNTTDIPRLAEDLMDDTDLTRHSNSPWFNQPGANPNDVREALEFEDKMKRIPWYYPIGTSLLFEAVVLLLAGRRFSKMDF